MKEQAVGSDISLTDNLKVAITRVECLGNNM